MRVLAAFALLVILLLLPLFGCNSPTGETNEPDGITIANLLTEEVDTLKPLLIWEGNDGSRLEVTGWRIVCFASAFQWDYQPPYENFDWRFLGPDGSLSSGIWDLPLTFCEIRNEILTLTYEGTGQTMTISPSGIPGCPRYEKRLPSTQDWMAGKPREGYPQLPEAIVLPSPMPELTFRMSPGYC